MGADAEKERISAEITRSEVTSPNEPILPTVNPAVINEKKSEPPASGLHPAVYVVTWITLSSSVIIFNKWILDTAKFRKYWYIALCRNMLTAGPRLSHCSNMLAFDLRDDHDPDHGTDHDAP